MGTLYKEVEFLPPRTSGECLFEVRIRGVMIGRIMRTTPLGFGYYRVRSPMLVRHEADDLGILLDWVARNP